MRKGEVGHNGNVVIIWLQRERIINGERTYVDKAPSVERCEGNPETFAFGKEEKNRTLSPSQNFHVSIQKFRNLMLGKRKSFKVRRDGKKHISERGAAFKREESNMHSGSRRTRDVKSPLVE